MEAASALQSSGSRQLLQLVTRGYYLAPCTQRFTCVGAIALAVGVVALFLALFVLYYICCPSYCRDFWRSHRTPKAPEVQQMTAQQLYSQQYGPAWVPPNAAQYPPPDPRWQTQHAGPGAGPDTAAGWLAAASGDPYKAPGYGAQAQVAPQYGHAAPGDAFGSQGR